MKDDKPKFRVIERVRLEKFNGDKQPGQAPSEVIEFDFERDATPFDLELLTKGAQDGTD